MSEAERKQQTFEEVRDCMLVFVYINLFQTRRSLPIFPFKESLLQVVKDHQVQLYVYHLWIT